MIQGKWDRRIRRATELISVYPFAAEGLRFYVSIASLQQGLYTEIQQALRELRRVPHPSSLCAMNCTLPYCSRNFPAFYPRSGTHCSRATRAGGQRARQSRPAIWQQAMQEFWRSEFDSPAAIGGAGEEPTAEPGEAIPSERVLAWLFLQPYAEVLADRRAPTALDGTPFNCPLCGGNPIVGVLRSEGDGAKKSLICMLCAHEWAFRRVYCPGCGEEREPQMAFYSAPEIAHVRVDVCDTCHTYLKSIDLTKTGLAVPIVDELATTPLDLWARGSTGFPQIADQSAGNLSRAALHLHFACTDFRRRSKADHPDCAVCAAPPRRNPIPLATP